MRLHDIGQGNVEELAKKVQEKGFTSIQLALKKALPDIDSSTGNLSPGLAYYIKDTFQKANVQIAILGCYLNITHPDDVERAKLQEKYKEHIRYVRDFGCSIVGTETGSMNAEYTYCEENESEEAFQRFIESLKPLVEEAEKFGVIFAIETVKKHIINTPQRMKRVLDTIQSNNLQVIFDAVNLLDETNYQNQDQLINEAFDLFGDRMVIIHAKDFVYEDGELKVVPPGKGQLNYELYLKRIKERKPYINILVENVRPEFMEFSKNFIADLYQKV
jgi:sugar phosphate isomerase/epimerase